MLPHTLFEPYCSTQSSCFTNVHPIQTFTTPYRTLHGPQQLIFSCSLFHWVCNLRLYMTYKWLVELYILYMDLGMVHILTHNWSVSYQIDQNRMFSSRNLIYRGYWLKNLSMCNFLQDMIHIENRKNKIHLYMPDKDSLSHNSHSCSHIICIEELSSP